MKHYLPLIPVAALALLSACNKNDEPEVVGGPADPMAEKLANAAPVELPPMVKESHQYRCKDNSLVFVDFMSDERAVTVRNEKDGAPTKLTAAEAGKPFEGGGFKVEGTGKQITATLPGKSALSCKA